ncbi:MAG: TerC family protein [Planctomycetes bacterium]|nr:TerC family protein [Planctomycetota bacterium]
MLLLDLFVLNRNAHAVSRREALTWSIVWITMALLFAVVVGVFRGFANAELFLTGYLLEKALSVDNLFVFLVIFDYFGVTQEYQHRVLHWGIVGALLLRAIFIGLGAAIVSAFHWVMYIFGAFLVFTAIKLCFDTEKEPDVSNHFIIRFVRRFMRLTDKFEGGNFFVLREGRRWATPLFVVLLVIEFSDVMFAVDSIPAIFGITTDPFLVYTSNIFAILGLRALYFLLAGVMGQFVYLHYGLAAILGFVGIKMFFSHAGEHPSGLEVTGSLGFIVVALSTSMGASVVVTRRRAALAAAAGGAASTGGGTATARPGGEAPALAAAAAPGGESGGASAAPAAGPTEGGEGGSGDKN